MAGPLISVFERVEDYVAAAREHAAADAPLPILAEVMGEALPGRHRSGTVPHRSDGRDLCLVAAGDPVVCAAGGLLAARTGRPLREVALDGVYKALAAAVGDSVRSIALVAPGWDRTGKACPDWLRALMRFAREKRGFGEVRWGLVTAPTPAALTRLVAATLADPPPTATAGDARVTVASLLDETLTRLLPGREEAPAGLAVVDHRHAAHGSFGRLLLGEHAALVFRGHGRSYCALDGHLCGARFPSGDLLAELESCLGGADCQAPFFARTDPRAYRASVMVLDCCGAANATAPNWELGLPSLAFHALAGSALAVIASDGVTMGGADELVDVLAALASGDKLSDGVALLNAQRRHAAARVPFLLLGDPMVAGGERRFPGLVREASAVESASGIQVTVPSNACGLWRAELPRVPQGSKRVLTEVRARGAAGARIISSQSGSALWFLTDQRGAGFTVMSEELASFPEAMIGAALDLERHLAPIAPAVAPSIAPLRAGAEQVLACARALEQSRLRIGERLPGGEAGLVKTAERRWLSAHFACLESLVGAYLPGGLWPYRLWATQDFRSRHTGEGCPYCGQPAVLERHYRSPPLRMRRQRECMGCDLIDDIDVTGEQKLAASLDAAATLVPGVDATVRLKLSSRGGRMRWGAAAIALDGTRHGAKTFPLVQSFALAPGETIELPAEILPADSEIVAHRYRLKALLLVDGEWMLLSRPIEIRARAGT